MDVALRNFVTALKPVPLAYCDYIAHLIHIHLIGLDERENGLLGAVSGVQHDLHPVGGYLLSTKKTLTVTDINGRRYRVTVEEAD